MWRITFYGSPPHTRTASSTRIQCVQFSNQVPKKEKQKIQVEFVSANPTGPLHVGHGRGAAYGDAIIRLLNFKGHDAKGEYYVNDAGRQIDILTCSIILRGKNLFNDDDFPESAYKAEYISDIAAKINPWPELRNCLTKTNLFVFVK